MNCVERVALRAVLISQGGCRSSRFHGGDWSVENPLCKVVLFTLGKRGGYGSIKKLTNCL